MFNGHKTTLVLRFFMKNNAVFAKQCDISKKLIGFRHFNSQKESSTSKTNQEDPENIEPMKLNDVADKLKNETKEFSLEKFKLHVNNYVEKYQSKYNEIFGLNLIKEYYATLQQIEQSILRSYERRRIIQNRLNDLQLKLKDIRYEMDKLPRNSDHFVVLFTKEHSLLKDEAKLMEELKKEEENERQLLALFSENIRKSYQIEMERQVKQKSISYILSCLLVVFSFLLGKSQFFQNRNDNLDISSIESILSDRVKQLELSLNEILIEIDKKLQQYEDKEESVNDPIKMSAEKIPEPTLDYKTIIVTCLLTNTIFYILNHFFNN